MVNIPFPKNFLSLVEIRFNDYYLVELDIHLNNFAPLYKIS